MLRADPDFLATFRESEFPGGCAHACELETSLYLHLRAEKVQMDKAEDNIASFHRLADMRKFHYVDLFGVGPVSLVEWTSTYTPDGTIGQPTLASAEKGKVIFEESVTRLVEFVQAFQRRPRPPRVDHHTVKPTTPLPEF
jgi:creatinine amidohydrolase